MREWIQEEHREHKMYAGADGEAIPEEFREARNKGLYYLQFSGKTENEMRKKLAEQEFSPASVEDAILFLKHYRYLDDEDYALGFKRELSNFAQFLKIHSILLITLKKYHVHLENIC